MEERASELLDLPDDVLFTHGGCHIFALMLKERFYLPLLWVREKDGDYDHIGCAPEEGKILDVFGYFSHSEYIQGEMLNGRLIYFDTLEEEEMRKRFILVRGKGYYAHQDFVEIASLRARNWISKYLKYFDGTEKTSIPGLQRVKNTADPYAIF
jgi:hypothetical protein